MSRVAQSCSAITDNTISAEKWQSHPFREVATSENDSWLGVPLLTANGGCIGVLHCRGKLTSLQGMRMNYIFDRLDERLAVNAASLLSPILQHMQLTDERRRLNEELEMADRIRAHEMRGSLQLIASQAEFVLRNLEDRAATSKAARLETIRTNVELCSTLLTSTMMPTAPQFGAQLEQLDLRKLLNSLVQVMRYQVEARSPSRIFPDESGELVLQATPFMTIELRGTSPPTIAHRSLLQRALYNIASNAVKYAKTSEKGRLLIEISESRTDPHVKISFQDHGIGVTPDEAPLLFSGRFRGREADRRPGEGLGLKISREIIELHGGTLRLVQLTNPTIFEVMLKTKAAAWS